MLSTYLCLLWLFVSRSRQMLMLKRTLLFSCRDTQSRAEAHFLVLFVCCIWVSSQIYMILGQYLFLIRLLSLTHFSYFGKRRPPSYTPHHRYQQSIMFGSLCSFLLFFCFYLCFSSCCFLFWYQIWLFVCLTILVGWCCSRTFC